MTRTKRFWIGAVAICLTMGMQGNAQEKSLINTTKSPFVKMHNVNVDAVKFTNGFWADRFEVTQNMMVPFMWEVLNDAERSHSFRNFEIAAGLKEGAHSGPPFHDGDFYKWFESAVAVYAQTKDPKLDSLMDKIIDTFAKAQRADGYIHTPVNIEQRQHPEKKKEFAERLDFETYNLGHLMTAACLHYRVTGKRNMLDLAIKSTDYLYGFYKKASAELARNAICPSHYMGVIEMYRTTRDPKYLELAKSLVEIRKMVENGTDHNQDRIPFRQQTKAIGHAVRANYLYAGVADVVAETGDTTLLKPLELIWNDLTENKLYITGGCGALYDGVSPNGDTYDQPSIQQVHQAYGQDYQLPNMTAHNESCANIGNMIWNWRMLEITANARYADVMEQTLYNSILSAVSLDGRRFFYTNPLAVNHDLTYDLRWSKDREEYIAYCNCCPPNVARTVAEVNNYIYTTSENGVWCHMYAGSTLNTKLASGSEISLEQTTNYPWEGDVKITINKAPRNAMSVFLRIPGWANGSLISINGNVEAIETNPSTYAEINRKWKKGDVIELHMPMEAKLIQANPLVEETRNQVAVQRGPIVYSIESPDMPEGIRIFDIAIPADIKLTPKAVVIAGTKLTALEGEVLLMPKQEWKNTLYQEVSNKAPKKMKIQLIPHFAWNNRGASEMSIWMPLK